jgi:hypothetical protein
MKRLILSVAAFWSVSLFGQVDKPPIIMGDVLYTFRYENVQGTPFWKNDWMKSKVVMQNKHAYENIELKMDLVQNNFVFVRDDHNYSLTPDVLEVQMVNPANDSRLVFRRGFAINKFITPGHFVQVLEEGNLGLLKFIKKNTEEFTEYNDATKYKRFKLVEEFFVAKDNQFVPINLNKKSMEAVFGTKWPQVEAFLKQNDASPRDENGWTKAVHYFNSL